jgi:hypothetical protein
MKTQKQRFADLVENKKPSGLQQVWEQAQIFDWQDEEKPFVLLQDIAGILSRYIADELTCRDVEDWASLIEAADVALGGIGEATTIDTINFLANPELEGELTPARAGRLLTVLQSASPTEEQIHEAYR